MYSYTIYSSCEHDKLIVCKRIDTRGSSSREGDGQNFFPTEKKRNSSVRPSGYFVDPRRPQISLFLQHRNPIAFLFRLFIFVFILIRSLFLSISLVPYSVHSTTSDSSENIFSF